jgi:ADP-ribose pyrophosphatase
MTQPPPHPDAEQPAEILAEGEYFRFIRRGCWESIEPKKFSEVVLILPITDGGQVVLIEQYRIPAGTVVVEIPAGLVGDEAHFAEEDLATAAHRELLEETGYEATQLELLARGAPSPGSNSVMLNIFKASGLKKVAPGGGDHTEAITIHEIDRDAVDAYLARRQQEGAIVDLKVYAALYLEGLRKD